MLVPSYAELMDVLNDKSNNSDEITSRYTIVIAAAKRARKLIEGDAPMVSEKKGKAVSTAVEEIFKNKIKVVPEGEGTILKVNRSFEGSIEGNELDITSFKMKQSLNQDEYNNNEEDMEQELEDEIEEQELEDEVEEGF